MMFYKKELEAIKRVGRYRKRELLKEDLKDFASNDYLGLSTKKRVLKKAYKRVKKYKFHSSKASTLVNGYHPIHRKFEKYISKINGFERALSVGSGFLANLSLFEALPRRNDLLLFDEEYHASGLIAQELNNAKVLKFIHNDDIDLIHKIEQNYPKGRVIIAVEGIYSMSGDILNAKIFEVADRFGAILVVDEAHSVGVIGKNLLGVFEYYNITPKPNHIKMGTLGKALGSYGAYILSSKEIYQYLCNRAKAIIYATAISPFDIALAYEGFRYIQRDKKSIKKSIKKRKRHIEKILNIKVDSLILPIEVKSSKEVIRIRDVLIKKGFLVGAIRPPTVKKPILRVIPRINEKGFLKLLNIIKDEI